MHEEMTKGDWTVFDSRVYGRQRLMILSRVKGQPSQALARIENTVNNTPITDEDRANALMMAAAPDLHKALTAIVSLQILDENSQELFDALKALIKAEHGDDFAQLSMDMASRRDR